MEIINYFSQMWSLVLQREPEGMAFYLAVFMLLGGLNSIRIQLRARSMPYVYGKYEESSLENSNDQNAALKYTYDVNGRIYENTRLNPMGGEIDPEIKRPLDGRLKVYYAPRSPEKSFIKPYSIWMLVFTVFICFAPSYLFYYKYLKDTDFIESINAPVSLSEPLENYDIDQGITGVLYESPCEDRVSICSIEIFATTDSHSVARIIYNYESGEESVARIFITANNGDFDNTVGVGRAYALNEGVNQQLDITFGLHRSALEEIQRPYKSALMHVEVKGVDEERNIYIHPDFIYLTLNYPRTWFKIE